MTFAYDGADLEEIIKTFYFEDNTIYIDFLSGKSISYTFYDNSEVNKIKDIMIKQAIDRDEHFFISALNFDRKFDLCFSALDIYLCSLTMYNRHYIIMCIISYLLVHSLINLNNENYKIKELKKYRMFLQLLNKAEEINKSLKDEEIPFDIMYLDDYSYNKIKKIYKNYKNSKECEF